MWDIFSNSQTVKDIGRRCVPLRAQSNLEPNRSHVTPCYAQPRYLSTLSAHGNYDNLFYRVSCILKIALNYAGEPTQAISLLDPLLNNICWLLLNAFCSNLNSSFDFSRHECSVNPPIVIVILYICFLQSLEMFVEVANYFFTGVFVLEVVVKFIAFGFTRYFRDRWAVWI